MPPPWKQGSNDRHARQTDVTFGLDEKSGGARIV